MNGTQVLGYDNIVGYGPFQYIWDGNVWNNAAEDPSEWVTSFDSLFTMTDADGELIDTHEIPLIVIDQCGKSHSFVEEVLYPVIQEEEICGGNTEDFPAYNVGIPVQDVRYEGASLINTTLGAVPFTVEATASGDFWILDGIVAQAVEINWQDSITLVDTCGYETTALIRVRDCVVPNVFSPDGSGENDNFRLRGLTGFSGSKLLIYNRYGTLVFEDATASDDEFELVWNGRYPNGNDAPEGHYQWVLLRSDGLKETGPLTLLRQP